MRSIDLDRLLEILRDQKLTVLVGQPRNSKTTDLTTIVDLKETP